MNGFLLQLFSSSSAILTQVMVHSSFGTVDLIVFLWLVWKKLWSSIGDRIPQK
jgi:hypothetical protein